jgi:hypothetical protein
VAVTDELAGTATGAAETETVTDIVETGFEKLNEDITGNAATTLRLRKVTAELLLHDTVLETELLLLPEGDGVVTLLATSTAGTVLTGRIRATLKRLGGTEKRHTVAAADSICRTCVSSHVSV